MNVKAETPARRRVAAALIALSFLASTPTATQAQDRRPQTRNTTRTNINSVNRTDVNVNTVNRTTVNVNTVRRADVDVHVHGGYYYNPGPSVGALVATTLVVGAIVASLPPNCSTLIVNGIAYHSCGGTYYQPRYSGSTVTYIVVTKP
jgi:acetyl esterase/lipase